MANIVVYGSPFGSSFRPHWMLHELGLAYETKAVDFAKGEHKSPEYLAMNAAGQVPVLKYDDFVLTESAAMVAYLAEKHDGTFFGPNTPESHANLLRWQLFVLLNLNGNFTTLAAKNWGMAPTPEVEAKVTETLNRFLPVFEGWMQGREYIAGADFTTADVVCRSTFNYAEMAGFDLAAYPAITAWMARCAARPAYQAAQAKK